MSVYPYVKYPDSIKKIIDEEFTYPTVGHLPSMPQEQNKIETYGVKVIIVSFLTLAVGGLAEVLLISGVAIFLFYLGAVIALVENRTAKKHKEIFEFQLTEYYKHLETYNRKVKIYDEFSKNLDNYSWKTQHKKSLLEARLIFTKKPKAKAKSNTKGVSEGFFYNKLKDFFEDTELKINRTIKQYTENLYIPDFIVYNRDQNIYIDVEIDEPYVLNTREPIHYVETIDDYKQHKNDYRDDFFNGKYWIVIRFAEEQIVSDPVKCCNFIGKILYDLTFQDEYKSMYDENDPLYSVDFWNFEDSVAMSELKYREDYLKEMDNFSSTWSDVTYNYRNLKREKKVKPKKCNDSSEDKTGYLPF